MKTDFAAVLRCLDSQKIKYNIIQRGKTAILVISEYGRVLGFWSDIEKDSHFWVNQKFLDGYHDINWINPGGHRIWLSPERDFFISDLNKPFETYHVPAAIDHGNYECAGDNLSLKLSNKGILRSFAKDINCDFSLTRTVSLINDDKLPKFTLDRQIQIAGYEDAIELRTQGCPAGLWSLVQVPLEGFISVPVYRSGGHRVFFGDPGSLIEYNNGLMNLHLKPHPNQNFKICLKASNCSSAITCLHTYPNGLASLIIKKFVVGPDNAYVDTPWNEPDDKGYAVQFFCGGTYGFAELETHAPVFEIPGGWQSKSKVDIVVVSGYTDVCLEYRRSFLETSYQP
ncbi:MAG: hypothetical protein A2Y12_12010 [Planctomycetes bacterium GWF2_42_9]|nr:MAG: hypothetical protein A2Y12_12010 [Planctomycetes bacterium GWF2_42_9]